MLLKNDPGWNVQASPLAGMRASYLRACLLRGAMILGAVAATAVLLAPTPLFAQSDNSAITGTVTDPAGAVVRNADVTVTSEVTGADRRTVTNASGFYSVNGLAPGKYTVTVSVAGFSTKTITNNSVDPSIPASVNVSLALSSDAERVEVTAQETPL